MSQRIAKVEKVRSEFLSSISHELRTPLTAIYGWSETLTFIGGHDEDTSKGLAIIAHESKRLGKMVEELLEYTRIEDGRFSLNVESADIVAEVEEAIEMYRGMSLSSEMKLRYYPPEDDIPFVQADPSRLRQVLVNLLDNANKYGSSGEFVDVTITVAGKFIRITVRDYGTGVPESEVSKLKTKFYKGSNSMGRGSGIGLAVCDEIMKHHGGELIIENANPGLRCIATLPIGN